MKARRDKTKLQITKRGGCVSDHRVSWSEGKHAFHMLQKPKVTSCPEKVLKNCTVNRRLDSSQVKKCVRMEPLCAVGGVSGAD